MRNIAVAGCGELGTRHIQSFARIKDLNIYAIDPNPKAQDLLVDRIGWKVFSEKVKFSTNYSSLPKTIDLAVISTTSVHRYKAIKNLLSKTLPQRLILEKFLFSNEDEYYDAEKYFSELSTEVYVNCPRRYFLQYKEIKEILLKLNVSKISVRGKNWGLSCNIVHYLDLFSFFLNTEEINYSEVEISNKYKSKRETFDEYYGRYECLIGNTPISIIDEPCHNDIEILIETNDGDILINESKCYSKFKSKDIEYQQLYQSELSESYLSEKIELPTFNFSMKIHLEVLRAFKMKLGEELRIT